MKTTETPENYLSKTEEGWVVIHSGMPLCATTSHENALKAALFFKVKLPDVFWNGEAGEFQALSIPRS